MDEINVPKGSTAHTPDLSWSQVRETVLMLELAAQQIEFAMKDSNYSVENLAKSFTEMAESMEKIAIGFSSLSTEKELGTAKKELLHISNHANDLISQAVISFQFYDKLAQRLQHVRISLDELSNLVGDKNKIYQPNEWVELQNRIQSKYSTKEERAMFEAVINGMPVQSAVTQYISETKDDNIELF